MSWLVLLSGFNWIHIPRLRARLRLIAIAWLSFSADDIFKQVSFRIVVAVRSPDIFMFAFQRAIKLVEILWRLFKGMVKESKAEKKVHES